MSKQSILDQVRVASPCHARWEDMAGDERARFCRHCQKHVFNLSAMTRAEAEALIREKDGRFCGRFYRRRDGRMLTADCRVGRRLRQWRFVKVGAALAALLLLTATGLLASVSQRRGPRGPITQRIDGWMYDLKVRLGLVQPTMATLGVVCVLPPATNSNISVPTNTIVTP